MDVAVIGGGASGLVAAIAAVSAEADVKIYEKMNRVGKKILATGNGRCNYTNACMSSDHFHGGGSAAALDIIDSFGYEKTVDFFENLGIYPYVAENGRVYPASLQASSMLDVLRYEAKHLGAEEIVDFEVTELRKNKAKFDIIGRNGVCHSDRVILCCGGKAGPQFGSDGGGLKIAGKLGHRIADTFPALVQLKLDSPYPKRLAGIRFEGAATVMSGKTVLRRENGEILFTDYGISGPAILQISRNAIEAMSEGSEIDVCVDMFPDITKNELYDILADRFGKLSYKTLEDGMIGFINKKLILAVLTEAGLEYKNIKCAKLNKKDIYSIVDVLKGWGFRVTGHNGWQQAQTTAGGVDFIDVDSHTLESKKIKGLYFAGEILDVDGDCGGYNLQWAWSSGYLAGMKSAEQN